MSDEWTAFRTIQGRSDDDDAFLGVSEREVRGDGVTRHGRSVDREVKRASSTDKCDMEIGARRDMHGAAWAAGKVGAASSTDTRGGDGGTLLGTLWGTLWGTLLALARAARGVSLPLLQAGGGVGGAVSGEAVHQRGDVHPIVTELAETLEKKKISCQLNRLNPPQSPQSPQFTALATCNIPSFPIGDFDPCGPSLPLFVSVPKLF